DHDGRRIGVAANEGWHDRGIHHAQARCPVDLEPGVDYCQRIVSHFARADWMVQRFRSGPYEISDLLVGPNLLSRQIFLAPVRVEGCRPGDVTDSLDPFDQAAEVRIVGQVFGLNNGMSQRVRRSQGNVASAARVEQTRGEREATAG